MTLAQQVNDNHRRSLSVTLQLIDQALCKWDDWTSGHVHYGVMYCERDTLSSSQKIALRGRIEAVRKLIVRLRDDLCLESKSVPTSEPVMGQSSSLWEMSLDLTSQSLQGYGRVSAPLGQYLDPIAEQLAAEMQAIGRMFSRESADQ